MAAVNVALPAEPPPFSLKVITRNGTPADAAKIQRGAELAEKALNAPSFRRAVLEFTSQRFGAPPAIGYVQAERVWYCEGTSEAQVPPRTCRVPVASNEAVLAALTSGYDNSARITIVISLTDKAGFARTGVGPPETPTELDPGWLRRRDVTDIQVAENIIHEHMHRLGFQHNHGYSEERCGSIPYAVGKLACEVLGGEHCWPEPGGEC